MTAYIKSTYNVFKQNKGKISTVSRLKIVNYTINIVMDIKQMKYLVVQ